MRDKESGVALSSCSPILWRAEQAFPRPRGATPCVHRSSMCSAELVDTESAVFRLCCRAQAPYCNIRDWGLQRRNLELLGKDEPFQRESE
jgi:hypothetical protein